MPPVISPEEVAWADTPPPRDHDGWKTSRLGAAGIDPGAIAALLRRIRDGGHPGIDGLLIARGGLLLSESYFNGFDRKMPHQTRSAFKSVTGLLAGIAIDDGILQLEEPVAPLIARYFTPEDVDAKRAITVRHLLEMRSGLDCSEMPGTGPERESASNASADKVAADFGIPVRDPPGMTWRYCSANSFLLGVALESALARSGMGPLKQYLDLRLMAPLGILDYTIGRTPKGHLPMHGGARITLRDLAKFGQLILSGGLWRGRRVVPTAWVDTIRRSGVPTGWSWTRSIGPDDRHQRQSTYRHQWFRTAMTVRGENVDLIHSWGNGGQFVIAIPQRDLVVAVTGGNYGYRRFEAQKQVFDMLHSVILPATRDTSPCPGGRDATIRPPC